MTAELDRLDRLAATHIMNTGGEIVTPTQTWQPTRNVVHAVMLLHKLSLEPTVQKVGSEWQIDGVAYEGAMPAEAICRYCLTHEGIEI